LLKILRRKFASVILAMAIALSLLLAVTTPAMAADYTVNLTNAATTGTYCEITATQIFGADLAAYPNRDNVNVTIYFTQPVLTGNSSIKGDIYFHKESGDDSRYSEYFVDYGSILDWVTLYNHQTCRFIANTAGTYTFTGYYFDNDYNRYNYTYNISITVTGSNTTPTFVGSTTTLTVNKNASDTDIKNLLHASDTDSSQTLTWSQYTGPSHGSLSFTSATASSGSSDITPGGTITYTPTSGYAGADSFTVQVSDGTAIATRTINVTVNTPPTFVGSTSTLTVNKNASATDIKSLLHASDTDSNQTLTWSYYTGPSHGSLSFTSATASSGSSDITPGGTITYTPTSGYAGADSFTVQVSDGTAIATRTISVTVTAPEIDVQGKGTSIVGNGTNTPATADDTDFGSVAYVSGNVTHTFTIRNTGTADLNLSGDPKVALSGSADFSVTSQPTSPVTASNSTTFNITFDPSSPGLKTATISIANDDSDENPYTFTIQGTGTAALTVSGITANNKEYDGTTTATLNTGSAELVGMIGGDDVTLNKASAAGTFDTKNVGTDKEITVSGLTLGGTKAAFYSLTQPTTAADISRKTLSVSATGENKVYDGTTSANVTLQDNRVTGDILTATYTGAVFSDRNAGTDKTIDVSGISLTGTDAGNYTPNTTTTSTADITRRAITVTATSSSKEYDGTNTSTGTPTVSSGSVVSGDNVTWTQSFNNKNVGTGKTLTPAGTVDDGNNGNNYDVTLTPVSTGVIEAKVITFTGITADDKVYDGTTVAAIHTDNASLDGVITGDNVTLDTSAATGQFIAKIGSKNAGINKAVIIDNLVLRGTDADNYQLSSPDNITANITAKGLTVTGITAENKAYDGSDNATLNTGNVTLVGTIPGDNVTLNTGLASGVFSNELPADGKTVSISGLTLEGEDAGNYSLTQPTTTADIMEKTLTVTVTGINKIYDGTMSANVTLSDDRITGDNFTVSFTGAEFNSKTAGTGKQITVSGLAIDGPDAFNYSLADSTIFTSANINKRELTFTAHGVDKVYDGTTSAEVTFTDDRITGDNISYNYLAFFINSDAGNEKPIYLKGVDLHGTDLGNYEYLKCRLLYLKAATKFYADITPKALTITATGENKVYDGTTSTNVTLSDDRLSGDELTIAYTEANFADKNTGIGKTINVSGVTILSGSDVGNYSCNTTTTGTADITAKPLTVTAVSDNKTYDGTTASSGEPTITSDSLADADTVTWTQTFDTQYVGDNKTLTPFGVVNDSNNGSNYTVSFVPVDTGTITEKALSVSGITVADKTQDGTTVATIDTGRAALVGVATGDNVILDTSSAVGVFSDASTGNGKTVTISGLTISGSSRGNYTLIQPTVTANIVAQSSGGRSGYYITTPTTTTPPPTTVPPTTTPPTAPTTFTDNTVQLTVDVKGETGTATIEKDGTVEGNITVSSPDKEITLSIPDGTKVLTGGSVPTQISITPDEDPPAPPTDKNIIGIPYECQPDGTTFNPAINLVWEYDPATIPEGTDVSQLKVAFYNKVTGKWEAVESTVDPVNHTITAKISHFSTYAIVGPTALVTEPAETTPASNWGWLIAVIVIVIITAFLIIILANRRKKKEKTA
jgi:hypothetical protein